MTAAWREAKRDVTNPRSAAKRVRPGTCDPARAGASRKVNAAFTRASRERHAPPIACYPVRWLVAADEIQGGSSMSLKALCRAALAVAALFAIGAGAVQAQVAYTANTVTSVFYREFKKDGRFFVFNNPGRRRRLRAVGRDGRRHHANRHRAERRDRLRRQRDGARAVPVQVRRDRRGEAAGCAAAQHRLARRQDALHARQHFYLEMSNRIQPRFTSSCPTSGQLPGTAEQGRQQGQLPHPARQVQARGLVLQAEPRVRGPDQLARTSSNTPASQYRRGRQHRLGHLEEEEVPREVRPVQGAVRAPAADVVGRQQFVDRAHPGRALQRRAARPGFAVWGVLGGNKLDGA